MYTSFQNESQDIYAQKFYKGKEHSFIENMVN